MPQNPGLRFVAPRTAFLPPIHGTERGSSGISLLYYLFEALLERSSHQRFIPRRLAHEAARERARMRRAALASAAATRLGGLALSRPTLGTEGVGLTSK